jgi:2',3'-cyclic-nucleotide 2'-phosphodiesterase (5'-nucleotidase family)
VALAARVTAIRSGGPTLLLDAGDLMTGTPITTLDYHGVAGGAIVELMNRVGYDAMALGNHEFDLGRAACTAAIGRARFPVLCANLIDSGTGGLFTARDGGTVVIERGGVRIAIIGLILDDLSRVIPRSVIAGLEVRPSIQIAREAVTKLDPVSDLIVVLTHQGLAASKDLAREVPGIDVIVAGHDHDVTPEPIEQSGVLIVETGSRLERLGRLDLRVEDDRVSDHRYQLIDLAADEVSGIAEIEPVRELVAEMDRQIQADYGQVLAELLTPFERRSHSESNVGNWVTDALRQAGGAEFAVANSSGFRTDVPAGPLTKRQLYGVAPFPNVLCTFLATGEDLLDFARSNARKALGRERGESSIVQVSGLSYTFDRKGRVSDLRVGGRPVEPDSLYKGASHDFLVLSQAERYLGFEPRAVEVSARLVTDVLYAAARAQGRVDARVDARIRGPVEAGGKR